MEKAGIDEDALDVLGSYALPVAATAETIREIMGAARPARVHPTTTALAATAGVMATAGILGALWMWGGRDVSALGVGGESTLPARLYVPPRGAWMGPQSRVSLPPTTTVLPPGEEALNWVPAEPGKSAAAVVSTTRYRRAGETGARVNNAYGVYKTFPTGGRRRHCTNVAASLARPVNFALAVYEPSDESHHRGLHLIAKDERNLWRVPWYRPGEESRVLGEVREEQDVTIVYRTWAGSWDVYLDGELVARDATSPRLAGKPLSGLWMTSGRGDHGSDTYFDELSVTAREPTPEEFQTASAPAHWAPPPPAKPSMRILSAVANGVTLQPDYPVIKAKPGERIQLSLKARLDNPHGRGSVFPVIVTPSWGDPRTSYREVMLAPRGVGTFDVTLDCVAPLEPGVYHIIVAGAAETTAAHVASGTNWAHGEPVWANGAEIARWPRTTISDAMVGGKAGVPWPGDGQTVGQDVAAGVVMVGIA